ncbi:hypothetical protein D1632_08350 [Chryseobacterium nematophagum]|uniref:Uncharacterized protein n=1 Tax=Chryseobacterium nematophagum TaxID=2305228 RepID=A0A3M7LA23_9FLAO|nr:hypothetical protein [Chryseobacterium nematophagum]RMZ59631.1 hypothetical protein D1632_08350 [Chryseobacterium nematophagum]
MTEYFFEMINKGDFLLYMDGKEIFIKRKFGGFVFTSNMFIDKKLVLTSKLTQILFYRKLKITFSESNLGINLINNHTFNINKETISYKSKALNFNPNYSFYSNGNLILECYMPKVFSSKKQYKLLIYNENENIIQYILCFFIIFSLDDIAIE